MSAARGPLRIAFIVHGRFHMFDLAREVLRLGHDVRLYTNYPRRVAARFGVPPDRVSTVLAHGVGSRLLARAFPRGLGGRVERIGNGTFGRWLARAVPRREWDVVASMSGIALELFRRLEGTPALKVLHRTSIHIRAQREWLDSEAARVGAAYIDKPSDWIIAREEEEYARADLIHVLSTFARDSFPEAAVRPEKFGIVHFGVDVGRFRAAPGTLAARVARVRAGGPLRVLNVGTFCLRKGAAVWADALAADAPRPYAVRFVGPVAADAAGLAARLARGGLAEFRPKVPQFDLPAEYAWGDVFALPTVEDGFPMVFNQALAAGLPLVTTPNCCGPDIVREGRTGWIVPPQDAAALDARLRRLAADRPAVEAAISATQENLLNYDWSNMAREFLQSVGETLDRRRSSN